MSSAAHTTRAAPPAPALRVAMPRAGHRAVKRIEAAAFSAVGAADPAQRSTFLALGISQALNTTSLGLIIAIPTLLLHTFLVGRVETVIDQVEETSARVIQAMGRAGRAA